MNKYPIYIPSKGRWDTNLTAQMLMKHGISNFFLVVEHNDYEKYCSVYDKKNILKLDGSDYGDVSVARNFAKSHAMKSGSIYHWQIDDDIPGLMSVANRQIISTDANLILKQAEQFVDQFVNVGMAGFSSNVFGRLATKRFCINKFVYTCYLLKSDLPYSFRAKVEDDLDFNLQILTGGFCTIQMNMFLFKWSTTGTRKGGYTELYANNRRLIRQKNTIELWKQFDLKLTKKKDCYRIVTNQLWKNFTQPLLMAKK